MDISIVIPSYNEMANVKKGVLDQVYSYLKKQNYTWELLLSDDGSTDGTLEELNAFAASHPHTRVLNNSHKGKGPTVISGLEESIGKQVLFTDFDQATPIHELEKLLPHMKRGVDIVIGSREIKGAEREKEPLHRHIMGKGFNFLVRLIAINGISDTQCGFKLFSRKAVDLLCPRVVIYGGKTKLVGSFTGAFDVELLFIAKKIGLSIDEVPVLWKHVKTDRVDPVKDSLRMLIDLLRIRFTDMSGKYSK